MDEVFGHRNGQVTTNGSRGRLLGIRRPHQVTNYPPRLARTLDHHHHRGASGDERDQTVKEGLALVLGVVTSGSGVIEVAKFTGHNAQLLGLEASDNFANETTLDAVGLHDDQSSIHEGQSNSRA